MIRFVSNLPYTKNNIDVIFTELKEIKEHINLLCSENISFDSFVYAKSKNEKYRLERAFSFFLSTEEDCFYCDNLNPVDIGNRILEFFYQDKKHLERKNSHYLEFSYELFEVRYQFYGEVLDLTSYKYNNEELYSLKVKYPEFIRKYEKRSDFRLKLSMKTPVWFQGEDSEKKRVINLSATGAAIPNTFKRRYRTGEKIRFYLELANRFENIFLEGEIVYASGNKIGLKFVPFYNSKKEVITFKRKQQILRKFIIKSQITIRNEQKQYEEELERKRAAAGKFTKKKVISNKIEKQGIDKKVPSYIELNKPFVLIMDNVSRKEYEVLELKYKLIQTHYIRAESFLKMYPAQAVIFKPDYKKYQAVAKYLTSDFPYRLIPKIIITENFTKDFILSLRKSYGFQYFIKDPFQIHQLMSLLNELTETFPLDNHKIEVAEKLKKLKYLFVSNSYPIVEGLARLFYDQGLRFFEKETNPHKMSGRLANSIPDILLLDNSIQEIDVFRLTPILKRNPNYKKIKVVMLVTRNEEGIIEAMIKNQVDRYLFFPFKGDDLFEILESLLLEMN